MGQLHGDDQESCEETATGQAKTPRATVTRARKPRTRVASLRARPVEHTPPRAPSGESRPPRRYTGPRSPETDQRICWIGTRRQPWTAMHLALPFPHWPCRPRSYASHAWNGIGVAICAQITVHKPAKVDPGAVDVDVFRNSRRAELFATLPDLHNEMAPCPI